MKIDKLSIKCINNIRRFTSPFSREIFTYIRSFFHKSEPIPKTQSDRVAIIIGNGPSFNDSYAKYHRTINSNDCFMVNHAVESNYFQIIKPKYYVLADPYYFGQDDSNEKTNSIIKALNKVSWEISIIIPESAKDSYIVNQLNANSNVSFIYYNSISLSGELELYNKRKLFKLWNRNKLRPLSQTVLNTAVSIAITMRYKNIYLIGADTSWIEMLCVDQKTNDLYSYNKHFYQNEKLLLSQFSDVESNVANEITHIRRAFISYQMLKEYAKFNGCELYNASDYSLIDTIERKKLDDLEKKGAIR